MFSFIFLKNRSKINSEDVSAASLAGFDPGYIISDYQMGNYNSMSENDIQAFLTKKNSCQNTNYNYYLSLSANSNYTWHWENGHFICLSEERFGDGEIIGSGETAAHIIWQAAQDYHINPQVLIVLLQKETSLITDPIPNNGDYRKAVGYGCPDTAPCSSQYYGFKNQVRKAAELFHTVLSGGWTNYPLGNNYVQYNPNAACGGSVINIRSLATSALYRYTPYQPNDGALAAGYGTAYCGAYGNRNFYLYFEDWFGGITEEGENYDISNDDVDDEIKEIFTEKYESKRIELGRPISKTNCNIGRDNACVKAFDNGILLYDPKIGILESYGEVRKRHLEVGSIDGVMGFPISAVNCNIGHEGACVQAFENGVIIYSPTTGAWESYGEIKKRYTNNGSVDGIFGFPIEGIVDNGILYQRFEKGSIIKDGSGKYWVSNSEIVKRYAKTVDVLGDAMANINCNIGHDGACVQAFENGVIIYSPTTGAWESYGEVRKRHLEAGSIDGEYGFPIGGVEIVNGAQTQKFLGGNI